LRVVAKYTKAGVLEVKVVKDNSLHIILNRKGVVESIDAVNGAFVLKQEKRTLTVKTTTATKVALKGTGVVAFADIKVGDKVSVEGIINLAAKTVDARTVTIAKREVPQPTPSTTPAQ
jgi:RecJ-like exonuclease